jgi:hypothetical protein
MSSAREIEERMYHARRDMEMTGMPRHLIEERLSSMMYNYERNYIQWPEPYIPEPPRFVKQEVTIKVQPLNLILLLEDNI